MSTVPRDIGPVHAPSHGRWVACSLRSRQCHLLAVSNGGWKRRSLPKATGIDRSSTSELVTRLVSLKWLYRRRSNRDMRSYAIRLTEAGRERLAVGRPAAEAANEALLSVLPAAQHRDLERMLDGQVTATCRDTSRRRCDVRRCLLLRNL